MSKINLALELNPETPFNQSQADALSSLIFAYSDGESTDSKFYESANKAVEGLVNLVNTKSVKQEAAKTEETAKEEKVTTTTTSKAKTAAQKKAEAAAKAEAEKNEPAEEAEAPEAESDKKVELTEASGVTPEDIKVIVGKKVEAHRDTIKAELSRLGFDSLPLYLKSGNDLGDFKEFLENLA